MDLVYWQDSLHYMLDVSAAVRWSRDVLISRGVFFMNEYVGPNRLQWSDRTLRLASRVLETLPKDYLRSEVTRTGYLSRRAHRMDAERIAAAEPTNCVDSERILDSVRAEFPDIEIQQLGGVVYYLALNGVMRNIREEETVLMDLLMLLDEFAVEAGENVYATAVGRR